MMQGVDTAQGMDYTLYRGYGMPPAHIPFNQGDIYHDAAEGLTYWFTGRKWLLHSESWIQMPLHKRLQAEDITQEKINPLPAKNYRRIIDLGD